MKRKKAATASTGGKGYSFADKVAARFMAQMLKRAFPFEHTLGVIERIHWETGESGHPFDDFRLELKADSAALRVFTSAKSDKHLTGNGFDRDFVSDSWDEWNSPDFRKTGSPDILALITGTLADGVLTEWNNLLSQAREAEPDRIVARVAQSGQMSQVQRAIFNSFEKTPGPSTADRVEIASLISRIRVLRFTQDTENESIALCSDLTVEGTIESGTKLWNHLQEAASNARSHGGTFDLQKLLDNLRSSFVLKDYPDFVPDWERLARLSTENMGSIRAVIGDNVRLLRTAEKGQLKKDIEEHSAVAIVGESGTGKSVSLAQVIGEGSDVFKRVVWLKSDQLFHSSQLEAATALGLRHSIPTLIETSAADGCLLILDGFEQFEGAALKRAIELIATVQRIGFARWKLVVTCESHRWLRAQDTLIQGGVADFYRVDFEKPKASELIEALKGNLEIRFLFHRQELQPVLRNLVLLDWVLRANIASSLSGTSKVYLGETELIDYIWDYWTGAENTRLSRDVLLRHLGEAEGSNLSQAIHRDNLTADQLALLSGLEKEGLIRISGPWVSFQQDLIGDWARYRVIKFSVDATRTIKEIVQIPRWGTAIRLFAQSLAEQGDGLAQWRVLSSQLGSADAASQLANDIFLDGIIFAANSESLMEQIWSDLIADRGAILRRLIARLQNGATFPDFRFQAEEILKHVRAEDAEKWFRIPNPLYWFPALRVFSRHAADICKFALLPAARLCGLWLRTMPAEFFGSDEAASLAVELAKEVQGLIAEELHFGDKDQVIYEALMLAANELPEEATNVALELCGRRPVPRHAILRAVEANEREIERQAEWKKAHPEAQRTRGPIPPFDIFSLNEVMREPHPDGPQREIPDGLRLAVLDTTALGTVIRSRPVAAKEVLLAACINAPRRERRMDESLFRELGLSSWTNGYPAAYWKGPFLTFLQQVPDSGLEAVVRLVNYATERWLEPKVGDETREDELREYGLEFRFRDSDVLWLGDPNVYGWHRHGGLDAATVECALMALEKWLYDEVANGKSIDKWVEYIFTKGKSLAFAGVLVSVGLKYPALFATTLQPLLGNVLLYECQMGWAVSEGQGVWLISWTGKDQASTKLALDWHEMPHRRLFLRDVAQQLMIGDPSSREYLTKRSIEWAAQFAKWGRDDLKAKLFLAMFDPQNYVETSQDDGSKLIELHLPKDLDEGSKAAQQSAQLKMSAMTLAPIARACLSGERTLTEAQLPSLIGQLRRLADWQSQDDPTLEKYRLNSLSGGLAVLLVQHRDWLATHPEHEKWTVETLRAIKLSDDPDRDSPHAIINTAAEAFLAEAGIALLSESTEEWISRLVFEGATGFFYSSTFFTLYQAYLKREQLGGTFARLLNVVLYWSALRRAANRESQYEADRVLLAKYRQTLFQRFVGGRLPTNLVSLQKIEMLGTRLVERITQRTESARIRRQRQWDSEPAETAGRRKLHRIAPDIDITILEKGFGFVWDMVRQREPRDESLLHRCLREILDAEMRTLPIPQEAHKFEEIDGPAYEFDTWILERLAEFLANEPNIEIARSFYRPLLKLGAPARYWIEDFLQALLSNGVLINKDFRSFAQLWTDLVDYAMSLPSWQPTKPGYWCPAEPIAADLMGLRDRARKILGDVKHAEVIRAMSSVYEKWASVWLRFSSPASWFAYFLITESGTLLIPMGLKQFALVADSLEDRAWQEHGLADILAEVLSRAWKHFAKEIELQIELRSAFLRLLTILCARQVPEALHLRTKVAGVLS